MTRTKKRCKSCYNKEDKTCCKRTCGGWVKILLYYIIFLFIIVGMLMIVLFNIARTYREKPEEPAIRKLLFVEDRGPGATVVPNKGKSVIWYDPNSKYQGQMKSYTQRIDRYMKEQKGQCRFIFQTTGMICNFNETEFGPCGESTYGYEEGKPCIFLKLNKIPTWSPEKFGSKSHLPEHLEGPVRNTIDVSREVIHVDCQGKYSHDKDLIGRIKYYPEPMFGEKYFPLPKGASTNPVVAIQLENIKPMQLVTLECSLYAKNIKHDGIIVYFYLDNS